MQAHRDLCVTKGGIAVSVCGADELSFKKSLPEFARRPELIEYSNGEDAIALAKRREFRGFRATPVGRRLLNLNGTDRDVMVFREAENSELIAGENTVDFSKIDSWGSPVSETTVPATQIMPPPLRELVSDCATTAGSRPAGSRAARKATNCRSREEIMAEFAAGGVLP
jgi:hypothetical protein